MRKGSLPDCLPGQQADRNASELQLEDEIHLKCHSSVFKIRTQQEPKMFQQKKTDKHSPSALKIVKSFQSIHSILHIKYGLKTPLITLLGKLCDDDKRPAQHALFIGQSSLPESSGVKPIQYGRHSSANTKMPKIQSISHILS